MTNHLPSVLRHCWLGHQTCKNRRPYNLPVYYVGADVKPCSIIRVSQCDVCVERLISLSVNNSTVWLIHYQDLVSLHWTAALLGLVLLIHSAV